MKFRVKTPSDALQRAQTGTRALSDGQRAAGRRGVVLAMPARPFRPLAWPGTHRDVTWTSDPLFDRASLGWHRIGLHNG